MLRDDNTEVEIMETVDYGDTTTVMKWKASQRVSLPEEENLGKMGYQKQEFDSEAKNSFRRMRKVTSKKPIRTMGLKILLKKNEAGRIAAVHKY